MSGVNKAILIGRLGFDPEARPNKAGGVVTNLRVATSEMRGKGDARTEHTEWHRVVYFGRTAEVARDLLSKGAQVYVEGRIRTNEWTDKEGQKRKSTEIWGDFLQILERKRPARDPLEDSEKTSERVSRRPASKDVEVTEDPGVIFGASTMRAA